MTSRTKTEITIQTRRVTVVRGLKVRCHQCGAEVQIVTPANSAGLLPTTPSGTEGMIESGSLHAIQEPGMKLICGNPLSTASDSGSEPPTSIEGEGQ
jgi:hypothetical protein